MYQPQSFRETDRERIHELIERYPFATMVIADRDDLEITHLPVLLDRSGGEHGVLRGHVARANPIWRSFDGQHRCTILFHGPHGYISPTWYSSRAEVPTWNYAVVHARGLPRALHGDQELDAILAALVARYEQGPDRWRLDALTPSLHAQLRAAIVGFEMPIDDLVAKLKLSQNKDAATREGVLHGLRARGDGELAEWLERVQSPQR